MDSEEIEVKINHHLLKLMKKISRENNPIPPNRFIKGNKKYTRKEKHKKDFITEYYEEA